MKKINLKIKGMHCPSCEMLIEDALDNIGVNDVEIDSKTGKAIIGFDEEKVSEELIKKTIEGEGYQVE